MSDPAGDAERLGVRIVLDDLGAWDGLRLVAEYDPAGPLVRVNRRAVAAFERRGGRGADLVALAVAHELYHHAEATGAVPRLATRAAREAAADTQARRRVPVGPLLAAFVAGDPA